MQKSRTLKFNACFSLHRGDFDIAHFIEVLLLKTHNSSTYTRTADHNLPKKPCEVRLFYCCLGAVWQRSASLEKRTISKDQL